MKAKPTNPLQQQLQALIDQITRDITNSLQGIRIRCRACGQFFWPSVMSMYGCPVCDWHTARCPACGGEASTRRAVLGHMRWFAGTKGQRYGHAHATYWHKHHENPEKIQLRILKKDKE